MFWVKNVCPECLGDILRLYPSRIPVRSLEVLIVKFKVQRGGLLCGRTWCLMLKLLQCLDAGNRSVRRTIACRSTLCQPFSSVSFIYEYSWLWDLLIISFRETLSLKLKQILKHDLSFFTIIEFPLHVPQSQNVYVGNLWPCDLKCVMFKEVNDFLNIF